MGGKCDKETGLENDKRKEAFVGSYKEKTRQVNGVLDEATTTVNLCDGRCGEK